MRVMDGKDAAAYSISYYGRLESNAVRALFFPICCIICVKPFVLNALFFHKRKR